MRILIVDDEPSIADSLALILKTHGYTVRSAYSGQAAVFIAQAFHPDAVISDVVMPGGSGLDLANWLSMHCPETKVLLVSGNHDAAPMTEEAARRGLPSSILPKPVHPATILEFLASCVPVR